MNSPSLLLALAPVVTTVASQSIVAARSVSERFADSFRSLLTSDVSSSSESEKATTSPPTLSDALQKLTDQFRDWLRERGVNGEYAVEFHLAADGEVQLDVSGESSEQVDGLLATDSSWFAQLRQLAASMQAESAHRHSGADLASVSIEISPESSRFY